MIEWKDLNINMKIGIIGGWLNVISICITLVLWVIVMLIALAY